MKNTNNFLLKVNSKFEYFILNLKTLFIVLITYIKSFFLNLKKSKFIYVTAVDFDYFEPCIRLIDNLNKYDGKSKIVVYDIGLSKNQYTQIKEMPNVESHKFIFDNYPQFMSVKELPDNKLGNYSWKAPIVYEVIQNYDENIIWLDTACLINKKIKLIKLLTIVNGCFFVKATGNINQWTHPKTLDLMDADHLKKYSCVMSGVIGINTKKEKIKILFKEWMNYSLDENCIAPIGSSRLNHRQDQSLLQVLVHKYNYGKYVLNHQFFEIKINQVFDRVYLQEVAEDSRNFGLRTKLYQSSPSIYTDSIEKAAVCYLIEPEQFSIKQLMKLKDKKIVILFKDKNQFENFKRQNFSFKDISYLFLYSHHELDKINEPTFVIQDNISHQHLLDIRDAFLD